MFQFPRAQTGSCTPANEVLIFMGMYVSQCGVYRGGQHYSVLKEILMITFSLWCMGLLTNRMRTCAQKVRLVKKVNYTIMPREGAKLEIANFSCSGSTCVSH